MGFPRLPDAWRILREVDLSAIRQEAERTFTVLVVGDTIGEATRVAVLLSGDPDEARHPWLLPRAAEQAGIAKEKAAAAILVTHEAELSAALRLAADGCAAAGIPVVTVLWGAAGRVDGVVRPGESARVAVPALHEETVPEIAQALLAAVDPALQLAVARQLPPLRGPLFHELIEDTAKTNAIYSFTTGVAEVVPVANVPLNMADIVVLTKNQLVMSYKIALAAGKRGSVRDVLGEVVGVIGGGFLLRQGARSLIGLIPGAGLLPKVAVAYAGTWAIGHAVAAWAGEGRKLSSASLSRFYRDAWGRGRAMAEALAGRAAEKAPRSLSFRRKKNKALPSPSS